MIPTHVVIDKVALKNEKKRIKNSISTHYLGTDPFLYVSSSCIFFAFSACCCITDGDLGGWYFFTMRALCAIKLTLSPAPRSCQNNNMIKESILWPIFTQKEEEIKWYFTIV